MSHRRAALHDATPILAISFLWQLLVLPPAADAAAGCYRYWAMSLGFAQLAASRLAGKPRTNFACFCCFYYSFRTFVFSNRQTTRASERMHFSSPALVRAPRLFFPLTSSFFSGSRPNLQCVRVCLGSVWFRVSVWGSSLFFFLWNYELIPSRTQRTLLYSAAASR